MNKNNVPNIQYLDKFLTAVFNGNQKIEVDKEKLLSIIPYLIFLNKKYKTDIYSKYQNTFSDINKIHIWLIPLIKGILKQQEKSVDILTSLVKEPMYIFLRSHVAEVTENFEDSVLNSLESLESEDNNENLTPDWKKTLINEVFNETDVNENFFKKQVV